MSLFDKFKKGLNLSSSNLSSGIKNIFSKKKIDQTILSQFEDFLISADVGVETANELKKEFEKLKIDKSLTDSKEVIKILAKKISNILSPFEKDLLSLNSSKPTIIIVSGVNGVGKTTTIGKLGKFYKDNKKSLVFGAADTFRAAAIEQLELWSNKINVNIIKSDTGSDPASVAYKTATYAKEKNIDVALIDTAGRMQNKKNLMDEYKKIFNVLKKIDQNFPNETILVLDATTGQNALNQVEEFTKIHNVTGLIITKLDSTAKGGIVLAICKKYKLPILAVGMGENETDLHPFNAEYFAKGLLQLN
ncbi:MAG: signal recognition particle-docking protein FtsY [Pelagibacteraceae bacterium]|jgi:fused signal recognition particle receptor|nr:signal recognition particle-docking protein FtsY [Pelagibacteraceae bacterium]